jgi:hypothetical protein
VFRNRLLAAAGAAALLLGTTLPASAANTFAVQVNSSTVATVTVTMNAGTNVICDPGTAVTGVVACTNTVNATGNIRSTKGGTGTLTTTAPAATVTGTSGNTLSVSALKMTCVDAGSTGTHGTAVLASAVASASTGVSCASWPGPNIFNYNVNLSFGIDATQVNADTYSLSSGWTVVASTT